MKLKIKNIFDFEKGTLQSLKNIPGEYDFITASEERKTHNGFTHDGEYLVFAMGASGSLGRTHYVNGKFISSDLCFILSPKKDLKSKINMKFFHTYFNVIRKDIVKHTATGTSKIAINQKNFGDYELFLPEIIFQNDFYEKFKELKIQNDELIFITDKNLSYIKQLKQAILQEAIEGKLTKSWREQNPGIESASILLEKIQKEKEELVKQKKLKKQEKLKEISSDEIPFEIPESWSWCRIGGVSDFLGGFAFKSAEYVKESNNQIIRLGNVKNDLLLTESSPQYISDEIANIAYNYEIKKGDILITMTGTRRKRDYCYTLLVGELKNKLFLNQRVGCLRFNDFFSKEFLNNYFKTNYFLDPLFLTETGGVNQGNIGAVALKNSIIPLPPLEEQKEIVKKVGEMMKFCEELEKQSLETKHNSEKLMKSVLSEVFSK